MNADKISIMTHQQIYENIYYIEIYSPILLFIILLINICVNLVRKSLLTYFIERLRRIFLLKNGNFIEFNSV